LCPFLTQSQLSNRRAPAEIPQDAIIIRSSADPTQLFTPPTRPKKRKIGLGTDVKVWTEKIRHGDLLHSVSISDKVFSFELNLQHCNAQKMRRILDLVKMAEDGTLDMESLFHHARYTQNNHEIVVI
jgi:hypothetical protein